MKTIKWFRPLICALALTLGLSLYAAANTVSVSIATARLVPGTDVKIDGVAQTFYNAQGREVHPISFNSTNYVPIRAIGEIMGKNVNWDAARKTATLSSPRTSPATVGAPDTNAQAMDITIEVHPDYTIVIDGVTRTFKTEGGAVVEPILYNGSIYLPIRAIGEIMGKNVAWDSATQSVLLTTPQGGGGVTDFDTGNTGTTTAPGNTGTTTAPGNTGTIAPTIPTTPSGAGITVERAKEIALNHAGVKAADATFIQAKVDYEWGRMVYEIEFIVLKGNAYTEYDYDIDASTGAVVSYDYDIEGYTAPDYVPTTGGTTTSGNISAARAKEIVLAKVPGATAANIIKFKLDFDDWRWEYEGEIIYGTMEYEFEIDAKTGMILSWEVESIYS